MGLTLHASLVPPPPPPHARPAHGATCLWCGSWGRMLIACTLSGTTRAGPLPGVRDAVAAPERGQRGARAAVPAVPHSGPGVPAAHGPHELHLHPHRAHQPQPAHAGAGALAAHAAGGQAALAQRHSHPAADDDAGAGVDQPAGAQGGLQRGSTARAAHAVSTKHWPGGVQGGCAMPQRSSGGGWHCRLARLPHAGVIYHTPSACHAHVHRAPRPPPHTAPDARTRRATASTSTPATAPPRRWPSTCCMAAACCTCWGCP